MSLLRGVQLQRLAFGLGVVVAAAVAGGLFLPTRIVWPLSGPASPPPTARPHQQDDDLSLLRDLGSGTPGINDDIICGGIHDAPGHEKDPDAIELARFAVAEHNSKTNAAMEFVRLVKVRHQVVAGSMYYFTVEVREVDGGANRLYEAMVWLRPWLKFKRLEAFKLVANASNADQGTKMKI